jgi:hypothetical protein
LPYSNENYVRQPKQHWHFGAPLSLILPRKQPQRRFGCAESNQNELLATLEPIGRNDTLDACRSLLKGNACDCRNLCRFRALPSSGVSKTRHLL